MQDREIVGLFWDRDEQAIVHAAARYGGYCRTIASRILQNEADVEECVNDTYRHAWDAIPPAKPQNLRTYLGAIARHLAFDRYKAGRADKRGGGELPLVLDELSECLSCGDETEKTTEAILLKDCLERFLYTLSKQNRYIFLRRYWYADSIKDIADALGKSENTVSVTLWRLRSSLKSMLQKEGIDL